MDVMELQNNEKGFTTMGTRKKDIPCRPKREISMPGPKFPLLHEGEILVCRISHQRTLLSKILGSRMLRRWATHRIVLSDSQIYSITVSVLYDCDVSAFGFSISWILLNGNYFMQQCLGKYRLLWDYIIICTNYRC